MVAMREAIRTNVPHSVRQGLKRGVEGYLILTNRWRLLPDFLIIGAQRCGTTSLYRYLVRHPDVIAPVISKGVHFFDTGYGRGEDWYRAHFATQIYKRMLDRRRGHPVLTGEGSPYYLFHPYAAERIHAMLPGAKFVVMLRDPVERAYSQYQHEVARGDESLPTFEQAIDAEPDRLAGALRAMRAEPLSNSFSHQHHSYLSRGMYADQLERWMSLFGREQFLILKSEDFFADPAADYRRVLEYLGLPPADLEEYTKFNAHAYEGLGDETRERLREHFREPNLRLAELLGRDFGWSE